MSFNQASSEFRSPGVSIAERSSYIGESLRDSHSFQQSPWSDLAIISTLVGVCYWLVWPVGEYAVLDDWAFNKSLSFLNERGELRILHWNPMSLIGHVLWGWLFTALFGSSFTVTKLSVVVLHVLELFVLVRWLRWCGVPNRGVWLAALALMFHPLHFLHCYTYDTDVPAIIWQLVGLWCIARGLAAEPKRCELLLLGSVLVGWSAWTRQHGVVAWLAAATYMSIWERRLIFRRQGWYALMPGAALVIAFLGWYRFVHGPTEVFEVSMQQAYEFAINPPWTSLPRIGLTYAVYLGSFVAVLAVSLPIAAWRHLKRRSVILGLVMLWLLTNLIYYFYFERNLLFPYMRNELTPFGFFDPNSIVLGSSDRLWGHPTAWAITALSVLGFIALWQRFSDADWRSCARPRWVTIRLCTLWLVWQLAYIVGTTPLLFDRHLLILAPSGVLVFMLLTPSQTRWNWVAFMAMLLPLAHYSLANSHDIHCVSRLAFQAGRELIANEVPPAKINGGYAFDGWYLYETHASSVPVQRIPPWWWNSRLPIHLDSYAQTSEFMLNSPEWCWWSGPVRPPGKVDYLISVSSPQWLGLQGIGELSGGVHGGRLSETPPKFREVRRYPFVSGWRGRTKFVYVLQRISFDLPNDSVSSGEKP